MFDTPKESPEAKAARLRQQNQAESQFTDDLQTNLQRLTRQRLQQYGLGQPSTSAASASSTPRSGFVTSPLGSMALRMVQPMPQGF